MTALLHTQSPNRVLSNSSKGTNSCSPLVTRTQEDKPQRRTEKGFLLTQSRYCTSLHKRALGQEQLTCTCHARCTAPSRCVCICVVGQYLGRRILLLGFFRLGNKCFERYLLVNQGQFILVKFLTVQMHNQNHKCEGKEALFNKMTPHWSMYFSICGLALACKDTVESRPKGDMKDLGFSKIAINYICSSTIT